MLRLGHLEAADTLLLRVPQIVVSFEDRDPEFVPSVKAWLFAAEEMLASNRLAGASEIATRRGTLIAAERGFVNGQVRLGRVNARKAREALAADLLKQAAGILNGALSTRRAQVGEAEITMMQIVAVADRVGLIPAPQSGQSHTSYLQSVFQAIYSRPELTSLVVHVVGLLGNSDSLVMLDRSITNIQ